MNPLDQLNALKLSHRARVAQQKAQAEAEAREKRQKDEQAITEALTQFVTNTGAEWFLAFLSPRAEDADTRFPTVYFNPPDHVALRIDFRRQTDGRYELVNKDAPWGTAGCNFRNLAEALVAAEGAYDAGDF